MNQTKDQIDQWLKKLEQESWQLELLVSAFTIFLLIQGQMAFSEVLVDIQFEYDVSGSLFSFVFIFLLLLNLAIEALIVFLVLHLLLRGFWIGTIGLRSVQSEIDFKKLNYSDVFTERLPKRVVSLDDMVIRLDQICSVMFSLAFLVISIFVSFGLFLLFLGMVGVVATAIATSFEGTAATVISVISMVVVLFIFLTGLLYLIDYFTLGFFKKYNWISRWYYPIYRFYGAITLAGISRSIYYNLISKFSKRRIRMVYLIAGSIMLINYLVDIDQYQFYPNKWSEYVVMNNQYDNLRVENKHVAGVSIPSNIISGSYLELFIRYDPKDNSLIRSNCPELIPSKNEGINWAIKIVAEESGFNITGNTFDDDVGQLLTCFTSIYEVSVNDSIYSDLSFYYFRHPAKGQRGMLTMIPTTSFVEGENLMSIRKVSTNDEGGREYEDFTTVPFWLDHK